MAASGVGAIGASLAFSLGAFRDHLHRVVAYSSIGVALSILAFAWVGGLAAGIVVVLSLGLFASLVAIGSQTEVQLLVENRLRGRVMSLWTLLIMGGPAVGSVVAGAMAGSIGPSATSLWFAASCILLVLAVGMKRPDSQVPSTGKS